MSPREQIQNQVVEYLEQHSNRFNAPYGIIPSLNPIKGNKGKVRTITFGVSRYLDACVYIWSLNHITVQAQGALTYKIGGDYRNVTELLEALEKV